MSGNEHQDTRSEFERRTAELLNQSVERLDGRTRSRLTQARFRALEQGRAPFWRRLLAAGSSSGRSFGVLAPVGAVAAVVIATVLFIGRGPGTAPTDLAGAAEDFELLADADALELMSEDDPEFYEWALAQTNGDAGGDGDGVLGT